MSVTSTSTPPPGDDSPSRRDLVREVARINAAMLLGSHDRDLIAVVVALVLARFDALAGPGRADPEGTPAVLLSPRSWARRETNQKTRRLLARLKALGPEEKARVVADLLARHAPAVSELRGRDTESKLQLLSDFILAVSRIVGIRLDPLERDVLQSKLRPGYTFEQVGVELSLPPEYVRKVFLRVVREMGDLLSAEADGGESLNALKELMKDVTKTQQLMGQLFEILKLV